MRLAIGSFAAAWLGVGAIGIGCGSPPVARPLPNLAALDLKDAPYELADDKDLETIRDRFDALEPGTDERAQLRAKLSAEYTHRLKRNIRQDRRNAAYGALLGLASLWRSGELSKDREVLSEGTPTLHRARDYFARAGNDREVVLVLSMLREADPQNAPTYNAELQEIFLYTDQLAIAQYGPGAEASRSVTLLQSAAVVFPAAAVIDELVEMLVARQAAISDRFRTQGANLQLVRAHGRGVIRAAWDVVRTFARADRLQHAPAVVSRIQGLGGNIELSQALSAALADNAEVDDWVRLANFFRGPERDQVDLAGAMSICRTAISRFRNDAPGYLCAGHYAYELGSTRAAIRWYEKGLSLAPSNHRAARRLANLYQVEISRLAQSHRIREAAHWLSRIESFHRKRKKAGLPALKPSVPEAYAALGQGLVSLGNLEAAKSYLHRSVQLRPTRPAYEMLGVIALRTDDYATAQQHFTKALNLPIERAEQHFDRNRVLRLMGEALSGTGNTESAATYFRNAIQAWRKLQEQTKLAPSGVAEAALERGKLYWHLGQRDDSLLSFDRAIDNDPDGAVTHAETVAFLVVRGEYERALDAYHRALGSSQIRDYYKVYMSLWLLAEAKRLGRAVDPLVREFLAERDGRLWYDELARLATGRTSFDPLRARADTPGRQAKLYYYSAVLGGKTPDPDALLKQVLATGTILFFEYEMAKHQLRRVHRQADK